MTARPPTCWSPLLRWAALLGTAWLLASTLLYLAATLSRIPGAVRAVRWTTLPAVRRTVDAALAVSVVTGGRTRSARRRRRRERPW